VRVADGGVPVFLVPGNHERSAIPLTLGGASPRLRVFRSPGTEVVCVRGIRVAVSGLPFARAAEGAFEGLVAATRWFEAQADVRLLCTHLLFEGATVGPSDHVFRGGCDVVRGGAIPSQFAAVLSGHVHRSQVLVNDLRGRPLGAPVIYPGSVERTSFAERDESKCFAVLRFDGAGAPRGRLLGVRFQRLPARPMVAIDVPRGIRDGSAAARFVRDELARAPSDAVVSVRVSRDCDRSVLASLGCRRLRAMAPDSMNVTLSVRS
jgi:DNA repair exonuclease SbcCD nuclease subunit